MSQIAGQVPSLQSLCLRVNRMGVTSIVIVIVIGTDSPSIPMLCRELYRVNPHSLDTLTQCESFLCKVTHACKHREGAWRMSTAHQTVARYAATFLGEPAQVGRVRAKMRTWLGDCPRRR